VSRFEPDPVVIPLILEKTYLARFGLQVFTWVIGVVIGMLFYLFDIQLFPTSLGGLDVIIPLFGVILSGFFFDFKETENASMGILAGFIAMGTTLAWFIPELYWRFSDGGSWSIARRELLLGIWHTIGLVALSIVFLITGMIYFHLPNDVANKILTYITGITFFVLGCLGLFIPLNMIFLLFPTLLYVPWYSIFIQSMTIPCFLGIVTAYSMMWYDSRQ